MFFPTLPLVGFGQPLYSLVIFTYNTAPWVVRDKEKLLYLSFISILSTWHYLRDTLTLSVISITHGMEFTVCLHCGFKSSVRESMCKTIIHQLPLISWLLFKPTLARTVGPQEKQTRLPSFSLWMCPKMVSFLNRTSWQNRCIAVTGSDFPKGKGGLDEF